MEVRETIVMTFATSLNGRKNVRINEPRTALSVPEINNAANYFMSANPFDSTVGDLISLIGTQRVIETRTTII